MRDKVAIDISDEITLLYKEEVLSFIESIVMNLDSDNCYIDASIHTEFYMINFAIGKKYGYMQVSNNEFTAYALSDIENSSEIEYEFNGNDSVIPKEKVISYKSVIKCIDSIIIKEELPNYVRWETFYRNS